MKAIRRRQLGIEAAEDIIEQTVHFAMEREKRVTFLFAIGSRGRGIPPPGDQSTYIHGFLISVSLSKFAPQALGSSPSALRTKRVWKNSGCLLPGVDPLGLKLRKRPGGYNRDAARLHLVGKLALQLDREQTVYQTCV
jgi:hypothetical protein